MSCEKNIAELPKIEVDLKKEIETKTSLNHVDAVEKIVLPDKDAIEAEKQHEKFKSGIECFDQKELKSVETSEKNILPTAEQIEAEKQAKN